MDITDNNNTNEKNKNGCVTPDPDSHTLYSQGLCPPPHLLDVTPAPQTWECASGRAATPGVTT